MVLKIGDIVQLKSGSPLMTVIDVTSELIICTWFDGYNPKEAKFHCEALSLYEDSSESENRETIQLWD